MKEFTLSMNSLVLFLLKCYQTNAHFACIWINKYLQKKTTLAFWLATIWFGFGLIHFACSSSSPEMQHKCGDLIERCPALELRIKFNEFNIVLGLFSEINWRIFSRNRKLQHSDFMRNVLFTVSRRLHSARWMSDLIPMKCSRWLNAFSVKVMTDSLIHRRCCCFEILTNTCTQISCSSCDSRVLDETENFSCNRKKSETKRTMESVALVFSAKSTIFGWKRVLISSDFILTAWKTSAPMHVHAHLCIEVPFYKQTRINDWSRYATKKNIQTS